VRAPLPIRAENAPYADGFAAGASTGVDTGEEEQLLARKSFAAVDALQADVPGDLRMGEERLSFFLSCLRQAIEQELVQVRAPRQAMRIRTRHESATADARAIFDEMACGHRFVVALEQLRIDKPAPKLAQTNEVCERHVGLLLGNHPLFGTPTLEPFRQWCVQTAKGPILSRLLKLLSFDLPRSRPGQRFA
jgi:hypothetical protein